MNKLMLKRRILWFLNGKLIFLNAWYKINGIFSPDEFLFFDMTAVLVCVQNELVCVCHLRADSQLWQL